ncbi:MAG: AAA family ATPase [Rhodoferax sp.]|nr:AAA family ATPase [Rhodoferax sp.]
MCSIPPDLPRDDWHRVGRAAIAAGLDVDALIDWSRNAGNFKSEQDVRAAFTTITPEGGTGAGTLFKIAAENGWPSGGDKLQQKPTQALRKAAEAPRKPAPGTDPAEVLARCQPATNQHPYIMGKGAGGAPLDGLRVVPAGDPLVISGLSMAGALLVPAFAPDGKLQSAQLIPTTGKKMNLPGSPMAGASFTVGELLPGGVVYIVEGIGQAWACWQATGAAAVVCFGWGNVGKVTATLRQRDSTARLVLVPDVGKESEAEKIALEHGCFMAAMPPGEAHNFDASDLMARDGFDVLATLLEAATNPPKPEPRYKLLSAGDLRDLPPLAWRVRGVLPAAGLAALFGPSGCGKTFLAIDMAAAIAAGQSWFGCRIEAAQVVYAALEGEGGFKLRAQAWETHQGRDLPDGLQLMMQPFKLTDPRDVSDLAAVVPAGAVVFIDTLNRAAPLADENSSKDMGEILEGAKRLQRLTGGLVVLVHHTGKNAAAGLRGHSSLFAACDAAVEVLRDGDRREWKVAKCKDGVDGDAHPFKLNIETLGLDEYGDPVTSCVVLRDTNAHDVQRVKLPQGGNQRLVYEGIRVLFKDGATGKPGAPPLRPCIQLEAAVTAGAGRLTCATDRRATRTREAITGLVSRGVLGLNEGWLWTA